MHTAISETLDLLIFNYFIIRRVLTQNMPQYESLILFFNEYKYTTYVL